MGDVAGAARALGEFSARRFEQSRFGMPRHLLETLAELQREAGAMPDALITAKRLLDLDSTNGTAVALQLEQEMADNPDAPIAPMLDRLEAVKVHGNEPEALSRATRQLLDFWFQQLKRSSPTSAVATENAAKLSRHGGFSVMGRPEEMVAQLWRLATIESLLVESSSSWAAGDPGWADALSQGRAHVDARFAFCAERAKEWNVVTPEATACRKKQSSLVAPAGN